MSAIFPSRDTDDISAHGKLPVGSLDLSIPLFMLTAMTTNMSSGAMKNKPCPLSKAVDTYYTILEADTAT